MTVTGLPIHRSILVFEVVVVVVLNLVLTRVGGTEAPAAPSLGRRTNPSESPWIQRLVQAEGLSSQNTARNVL